MRSDSSVRQLHLFDALAGLLQRALPERPQSTLDAPSRRQDPPRRQADPGPNRPVAGTWPPAPQHPQRSAPPPNVEFVRHPRARRYFIRVRLDGSVRVTIPRRGSRREAEQFCREQREWIAAQHRRVAALRERLPADLPAGEQRAMRARARRELPPRLLELAEQVGVQVRKVSVRNQKHRWGSCSPSGLICLNWRLITMPGWVRDYVLYHELMHLKRMDHSPAFWALVAQVCPDYQEARQWLRRHALAPHASSAHADSERGGVAPGDDAVC
jgi:predicted metal-dependent hydrolase